MPWQTAQAPLATGIGESLARAAAHGCRRLASRQWHHELWTREGVAVGAQVAPRGEPVPITVRLWIFRNQIRQGGHTASASWPRAPLLSPARKPLVGPGNGFRPPRGQREYLVVDARHRPVV